MQGAALGRDNEDLATKMYKVVSSNKNSYLTVSPLMI